jgi:hypothetical protein
MKLAQAGALLPDQRLEEYLRERADLPAMDPEAVKSRGKGAKADTDLRKEVLTGGGEFGDAMGGNKPGGGAGTATPKSSNKTKPSSSSSNSKKLSDEQGRRLRRRALRPEEEVVNLDAIEDMLDAQPEAMAIELQGDIMAIAKGAKKDLTPQLHKCLSELHRLGFDHVEAEVHALRNSPTILAVGGHRKGDCTAMANHAAKSIVTRMELAADGARVNDVDDTAAIQLAAETEGLRAVRQVALGHGSNAYQLGRYDAMTIALERYPEIAFMYTSMLDNRVCDQCNEADDGIPRLKDDPVRLDRRPPNRHCLSTKSGYNYCRCLELPVVI